MSIHRPASPDIVACIHNGRIYKDGQNFPSNSTGMKVNSPNQCVQCRCQVNADHIANEPFSALFGQPVDEATSQIKDYKD
jgi:hypothetical protein